ncbi:alpha/beta fold hydrolase [Arsenicicoccus bolidensis]|uniref:Proline iminopeptidase n=1 Tax=Arsenicicoccus bolidensis TaxID=229480 RepID=A0ABS9Q121_9MICO|nr:alpha/beta fold hydrolase [Arsenicicoccus bolidensis]MCG7320990.1 alpha/beta hydrolase [Arsenicicoccus bolidensis]
MTDTPAPRRSGLIPVGDGHRVWWEEWGDPAGVPAVYLHGGPGGTLGTSGYRNRFDLSRTRVVGLDQRGCGRSTPHAADPSYDLSVNTTAHLIADVERLREHLGIDAWIVNGASWGSTLAFAYAQAHPDRVLGVVILAVTAGSRREIDWITEGVGAIYPEAWDRFAAHAESAGIGYVRGEGRLIDAYGRLMGSPDTEVREAATQEWALWEDTHVSIGAGGLARNPRWEDERFRHAFLRLTAHYWSHDCFCDPPILDRMDRLAGIPGVLLHGRRDVSSPAVTAWELWRRWPGCELVVDEGDGHGGATLVQRWREANDRLVSRSITR